MTKILHISDLHFGPPFQEDSANDLRREAFELNPDLIVASGDFTERATTEEFEQAHRYLETLPKKPIITVPGNHDVPFLAPLRGISPFGLYRQWIHPQLDEYHQLEGIWCAALNSTSIWGSLIGGWISTEKLEQCRRFFESAPETALRIVVAHHHFVAPPDMERGQAMRGARRALDQFTAMNVDLILGGHKHRSYIGNSLDFYSGKDHRQGAIVVQCGTSTSRRGRFREREKNTYNVIAHDAGKVRIQHFMHFESAHGFRPISEHIFVRGELDEFAGVQQEMQVHAESDARPS